MTYLPIDSDELKRRLCDPDVVLNALGLAKDARRQSNGLMHLCPWHAERRPSCSSTRGPDGTLRAHCFSCGNGGDVFSLAAAVLGLDVRADFARVVDELSARCGLDGAAPLPSRRLTLPPLPRKPPPLVEVGTLWARCRSVCEDPDLSLRLLDRSLDPAIITDRDLARTLPLDGTLPGWARHGGQTWRESGHALITPLYDAHGALESIHARSLRSDAEPKGLLPTGHSSAGLIMACSFARLIIAEGIPDWWHRSERPTFIVAEGLPDFLTLACHYGEWEHAPATIGVISGAWSKEVAERIPDGCRVVIRTHADEAGMRYRREVAESLCHRCRVEVPRHG